MPPSLNTQTIIAFIWDFDLTLTPGYMQGPLFEDYGVDPKEFWAEVNGLVDYYSQRGLKVSKDTAYLGHILSYVKDGHFSGLTNAKLRELGSRVKLAPGMPVFMAETKAFVQQNEAFKHAGISVEHYIVSTGLRQMIEGNEIITHVKDVWACELLSAPPSRGYLSEPSVGPQPVDDGVLTSIGYTLDNTTKTRAVFEINKGVNFERGIDVNARMPQDDRRVPFTNMIYIADGPSDVPVFSVVQANGGHTFGVHTGGVAGNYKGVRGLLDDGRVQSIGAADYRQGTETHLWLMSTLEKVAEEICARRDASLREIVAPAGHKV